VKTTTNALAAAFSILAILLLSMPTTASAGTVTDLTLNFAPPSNSAFSGGTLTGAVQLWTADGNGNIVPLGSATQLPSILANTSAFLSWDTGGTAACWISIGGFVSAIGVGEFPMFAFSSDESTWIEPGAGEPAPIVDVGMLNGRTFEEASGALVGFDGPEQIGTWTFTETAPAPEPATLSLTFMGLGFAGIVGALSRKRLA
jgi:hypothetical protein